jgi:glycosyltransferase involved in cell wall biosynthesis
MSPRGTGIGRVEIEITKKLVELLDPSQWEIHLYPGASAEVEPQLVEKTTVHDELRKINSTARRSAWDIPAAAARDKIDIFHSLDFMGPCWKFGFKLVQTVHDVIPAVFPFEASWKSLFMCKYMMPFMFASEDALLVSSENTKRDILRLYRGVKEEKIKVVPLAGREEFRRPVEQKEITRVKEKYGIKGNYFLFTGTLEPKKNPVRLAQGFVEFKKKNTGYSMVFAGAKGWNVDKLYEIAKENPEIIFTGFVPDEDLLPLVKGAFCFTFPSIYEGFGLPVLDAYNAGVPLITSNAASIPEIAGDAALLVDPYEPSSITAAMRRAATEPALREALVKKGCAQSEKFTWDKTAKKIIGIYNSLL